MALYRGTCGTQSTAANWVPHYRPLYPSWLSSIFKMADQIEGHQAPSLSKPQSTESLITDHCTSRSRQCPSCRWPWLDDSALAGQNPRYLRSAVPWWCSAGNLTSCWWSCALEEEDLAWWERKLEKIIHLFFSLQNSKINFSMKL